MAKHKSWHDNYENLGELGEGGNAKVYHVKCKNNKKDYALKELSVGGAEKKGRFIDEINIIKDNWRKVKGIIPIIEYSIDEYWYTMPIAESAIDYIVENKIGIEDIVKGVIQLCETLENLHENEISHRDIKPSNIYYYENRFCFGDFGLVDFPENTNDFTRADRGLGAIFTIAPEMKRNPKTADGKKADVFSLAKTLWMFLTKDEKGFDGVYNYLDSSHSLRYIDKYKDTHLVEIDELLKDATDNYPDIRLTITEFKERLINWIDIFNDMNKSQASDWHFLNKQLFGLNPPDSSSWRNINKIVEVLNIIGKTPAYNHMLFHDHGGLDFAHAEIATENNCIKLYDTLGFCRIIKPKILYFEGFDENYKWNYFLLELDKLNPVLGNDNYIDSEYLVEDTPAHYVSAKYAQYGVYDYDKGNKLPNGYELVYRYTKGMFLIVMKNGPYNRINGTYDGRHGDCSAEEFREYIDSLIKDYLKLYDYANQEESLKCLSDEEIEKRILDLEIFNRNPFRESSVQKYDKIKMREELTNEQKSKDYITQNFTIWDFSDELQNYLLTDSTVVKYVFEFRCPNNGFSLKSYSGISNYICTDGSIKKLNSYLDKSCYCIHDRKMAIEIKHKLEEKVLKILKINNLSGLEKYEKCFSIKLVKVGKPTHLFTKQEIEEEMKKADDRFYNQLVIDENGYAKVIKNNSYGYLYPVRHESWDAGNMYVGKYSKLSTLDDNYISSLQGWLLYLKTGQTQYMDYLHENTNEEELLKEIKEYYL